MGHPAAEDGGDRRRRNGRLACSWRIREEIPEGGQAHFYLRAPTSRLHARSPLRSLTSPTIRGAGHIAPNWRGGKRSRDRVRPFPRDFRFFWQKHSTDRPSKSRKGKDSGLAVAPAGQTSIEWMASARNHPFFRILRARSSPCWIFRTRSGQFSPCPICVRADALWGRRDTAISRPGFRGYVPIAKKFATTEPEFAPARPFARIPIRDIPAFRKSIETFREFPGAGCDRRRRSGRAGRRKPYRAGAGLARPKAASRRPRPSYGFMRGTRGEGPANAPRAS